MDVIESIKKDKAYLKCKQVVKNWEKDFKSKYARTPSKFDIKEAPVKIKYAYKKYFQLKSAALDSSLNLCDFDQHSMLSPETADVPEVMSPDSKQLLKTLPSGQELEALLLNAQSNESKETIKVTERKEEKLLTPFTHNLSKKLFDSRKFSMRNPRKLQRSLQSEDLNSSKFDDSMVEELSKYDQDLSIPINVQCSSQPYPSEQRPHNSSFINTTYSCDNVKLRKISERWIDRATGCNKEEKIKSAASNESFGLRNINATIVDKPLIDKACDYVENSESDTDDPVISKLKPALKKRKINLNDSVANGNAFFSQEQNSEISSTINTTGSAIQADLSLGFNKNDSGNVNKKRKKGIVKHEESEELPDISEFLPFGIEHNVAPLHENLSSALKDIENCKTSSIQSKSNNCTTSAEMLENKIKNGTLNENFVKINIEKKVYARGKKTNKFSKWKKQQWKDKKALHSSMEFPSSGKISCFKCGQTGHMARYCTAHRGDALLPLHNIDDDDDQMPTLEDMEKLVSTNTKIPHDSSPQELMQSLYTPSEIPEAFLEMLAANPCQSEDGRTVKPIFSDLQSTPEEVLKVLNMFGHESFRPGQEQAIMRILNGMSTLLLLSTGGGKSLCYQIPAYIYSQHYKCITLVISPLVSLMEDQVLSMPDFLKAGCLHTNQPPTQRQKIMQLIKDGELNILLISPEALISGDVANGFSGLFKSLPPIAFACIDEAHCVSQWSHNFRPSYLMICRVLREKLNVKCILGLTATASQSTIKSVIDHINVPDGIQGVITNPALPQNLLLSVSFEKDKDRALISLLSSEPISSYNSIIVYCIRRDECERVAAVLRSSLQEPGKKSMESQSKKRKRMSYIAEAYHAGMSAAQRKKIQKHFMDGVVRIIVATVAFGMGINKSDIRCIIHYNMPSSFESYVQEVGRAGRDGKPANCHVLMSKNSNDKNELLKHIHANTIDRPMIRKLIQKIFIKCECGKKTNSDRCKGHEVGIPIDQTVEELDVASENIATLLCYLELHAKKYIKVLNNSYTMCKIISYGGPKKIMEAAKSCPPLAMAYILESKKNPDVTKSNIFEFPVIEVAAAIGWDSGMVKYQLKNLEWLTENGTSRRSQLKVEFNTLGFRIKAPGDLGPSELDEMLDDLHRGVLSQEKAKLYQLEEINRSFRQLGNYSIEKENISHDNNILVEKSQELKTIIKNYFQREDHMDNEIVLEERPLDEELVISDVRSLIVSYKDCNFTGRSIARIFQGISSPNYPAIVWGRCKFWRTRIHEDFYGLVKIATQQIIQMKLT